jgi:hypothetical protein
MRRQQRLTALFAAMGMLILILDSKTVLSGMQSGINLCIRTVIPALFPFFLLSILLTSSLSGTNLPLLTPLANLLRIPKGSESILISGFLGGYPVGAQAVSAAYTSGYLSRSAAERMLSFCSNAGPAFLFGMVGHIFSDSTAALWLWIIHIIGAILVALFQPVADNSEKAPIPASPITVTDAMQRSIKVMATVCSWVILFRVLLSFLSRWFLWVLPGTVQVIITGLLELSNGCCELARIATPELRFVICSGMLAWGGLCVTMQTASVLQGLSLLSYLKGKILQALLSLLLSAAFVLKIWVPVIAFLLFLCGILRKIQNSSGNPAAAGV